jgi:hypothetical protein
VGGTAVPFASFRGRKVLFYFWASWDRSREALSRLQLFHEKHGAPSFEVAAVAFDVQGPEFPMKFLKPSGSGFTLLIDATCLLSRVWGIRSIPQTVLIDEKGSVMLAGSAADAAFLGKVSGALKRRSPPALKGRATAVRHDASVEILMQACTNYLGRGRRDEAVAQLEKALVKDPENPLISRQIDVVRNPAAHYPA